MEEMNDKDLKLYMEKLEEEFDDMVSKGEDIGAFLYFPFNLLTPKLKKALDEYLMMKAYEKIENGELNLDSFLVFQDDVITVRLEKKDQRQDLLQRLLDYFSSSEEYEKCAKVHKILTQL